MHLLDTGRIVLGLVLLVAGGELLVRGASGLATRIGMSSLVVGLTVVAFATSAPELAVTLGAVMGGEPGLATSPSWPRYQSSSCCWPSTAVSAGWTA